MMRVHSVRAWRRLLFAAVFSSVFVVFAGIACQKPIPPEEPTAAVISSQEDVQYLWDNTLSVLRKLEFTPDRQDRASGVITTLPTTSMQWHEPWRQDVADGYHLLESSLHTIRRVVTVKFLKEPQPNIDVQVDIYRASQPETQITSASSVLHGFAGFLPTTEGVLTSDASVQWVPIGRDGAMEERILRRILDYTIEPVTAAEVDPLPAQGA